MIIILEFSLSPTTFDGYTVEELRRSTKVSKYNATVKPFAWFCLLSKLKNSAQNTLKEANTLRRWSKFMTDYKVRES